MAALYYAVLVTIIISLTRGSSFVRICYFTNWSIQRPNPSARLSIDAIDPNLCTHILYAFANIDVSGNTITAANPSLEYDQGGTPGRYSQFNQIKQSNPNLRTLLAIGGENSAAPFNQISGSADSIAQFSRNAASFLRNHGFDGLDVDWEYPDTNTKAQYSSLLKGLRSEFNTSIENGEPLLLTAAVSAGEPKIKAGYDIMEISRDLDYILVMTYDFSGPWNDVTGFNSPLLARNDPAFSPIYNVDHAISVWLDGGADRRKVVIGMTGAGASFTLSDINSHGVGAPVSGAGPPGELYENAGRLFYPEICKALASGWTRVWDEEQKVPYAYSNNNWVGYDDTQSLTLKARYATEHQLAGAMFWELSFDDPQNVCGTGKFPLLKAVKETFNVSETETTPQTGPTTGKTTFEAVTTTTTAVGVNSACTSGVHVFSFCGLLVLLVQIIY